MRDGHQRWPASAPIAVAVLTAAVAAAMGPSLSNGFVYDDVAAIVDNSKVHSVDLGTLFSSPYWTNALYRPLTTSSFALLWQAGGGSPLPFHLANLVLAAASAMLVWRLARALGATGWPALLAAAIFAIHPVHVEAVANGVGLAELLSASLVLLACLGFARTHPSDGLPVAATAAALGAFLAKESAITVLALAPLMLLLRQRPSAPPDRRLHHRALTLMALALATGLAARTAVLGSLGGEAPASYLVSLSIPERMLTVLGLVPEWTRLLIWPAHLQADYSPPQILVGGPFGLRHLTGGLILAAWLAALFLGWRRRNRLVVIGLLWVPIALSPVSNLLFPTGIAVAERTLFLPSVGIALATAGIIEPLRRGSRSRAVAAALVLVALGTVRSNARSAVWRDQETFFDQLVIDAPMSYRAWYVSGGFQNRRGHSEIALAHLTRAWELDQRNARVAEELGQALRAAGRFDEALPVLRRGHEIHPTQEPLMSRLMETLIGLGRWEEVDGLIAEAGARDPEDGGRLRKRADAAREALRSQ